MDAKAKAQELVEKFTLFSGGMKVFSDGARRHAIQCAIIAVEEMLNVASYNTDVFERVAQVDFYESVLSELRTLAYGNKNREVGCFCSSVIGYSVAS